MKVMPIYGVNVYTMIGSFLYIPQVKFIAEEWAKLIKSIKRENQRCIFENKEILVTHSFNTYSSGEKEALLMVHKKKDGLFWRSESGATPIK